jgi:hypothetical protein
MDTRDLWEDQVDRLTKRCAELTDQVEQLNARLTYFEGIVVTMLTALVEGGIIVQDPDGEHSFD